MTTPITPALTPDEWRNLSASRTDGVNAHDLSIKDYRSGLVWLNVGEQSVRVDDRPSMHAIAALALHEQPFGFSRADVEALRHIASDEPKLAPALVNLADRIAALLPPEA